MYSADGFLCHISTKGIREMERHMFEKGHMVVCGNNGVCRIEKISKLDSIDSEVLYYIMQPVYEKSSTVYIPVEGHSTPIRNIMTKDEAMDFIKKIPTISEIELAGDRERESQYKACMEPAQTEGWVRIIRTLYRRNEERAAAGKKTINMDERYMKMAKNCLYGELAVSLGMKKDEVEAFIESILDKDEENA